jgi:putative two-component system response regulator
MSILQGYQLVKTSTKTPFMEILKVVITQSRENYNGTGIPRQLKGDAISPYAQIVHIVETFNILLKDNPKESVYQFFKGQRGEWFDPKLIEPFLEYFDYFVELRKKYIKDTQL